MDSETKVPTPAQVEMNLKEKRNLRQRLLDAHKCYLTAANATSSLRGDIKSLANMISSDVSSGNRPLQVLLRECENNLRRQEMANQTLLSLLPIEFRTTSSGSHMAANVFAMPELLENILSFLPTPDLLTTYRVNKTFYDTIEGSIKLQRALGLAADPQSHYFVPSRTMINRASGLRVRVMAEQGMKALAALQDNQYRLQVRTSYLPSEHFGMPTLGARCESMLLTQPPIKELKVYAECCALPPSTWRSVASRHSRHQAPTMAITSETGITVGQVLEAISRVREEHALCMEDQQYDYRPGGSVRSTISAETVLTLRGDDPALREKRRLLREALIRRQRDLELRQKRAAYAAARRTALQNGQPVPTRAEYEAAQALQAAGDEGEGEEEKGSGVHSG